MTGDEFGTTILYRRVTALEGDPKIFCFSKNFGEGEGPAGPVDRKGMT